jgi:hypothetical protein
MAKELPKYDTVKALMTAKANGTLPRGLKFEIVGTSIEFSVRGESIARFDLDDYATGEARRQGFAPRK